MSLKYKQKTDKIIRHFPDSRIVDIDTDFKIHYFLGQVDSDECSSKYIRTALLVASVNMTASAIHSESTSLKTTHTSVTMPGKCTRAGWGLRRISTAL
jgi:hypothetical protein